MPLRPWGSRCEEPFHGGARRRMRRVAGGGSDARRHPLRGSPVTGSAATHALDWGAVCTQAIAGAMDNMTTAEAGASIESSRRPRQSVGRTIRAYVALTKPRVLELLLVTTVPVMILAQGGF